MKFFIFRDAVGLLVTDEGDENGQARPIPNPVRTFDEAFADYRKFNTYS